jgi:tRNA 2-selenouridine synthase
VPGAVNLPVLTDAERAEVGTLHACDSFAARRLGAALVSANIAAHLRGWCAGQPRHWRPLLYCWRGGQRSRSFALVLREVGWKAAVVEGGWRAYRRQVVTDLATLAAARRFRVLTGLTGVGKTRLLRWLAARGENVLNLEQLASHRGSLLGREPDCPQPTQKYFESLVCDTLHRTDPSRPVWVEAESRRVGRLLLPTPLWHGMMSGEVTEVTAPLEARVDALLEDYAHFQREPEVLLALLPTLIGPHSRAQVDAWAAQVRTGDWRGLVRSLLVDHYDPGYREAVAFPAATRRVVLASADETGLAAACQAAREADTTA